MVEDYYMDIQDGDFFMMEIRLSNLKVILYLFKW